MTNEEINKEMERPLTPNEAFLKQWEANNQLYKICMSHQECVPDWIKNYKVEVEDDQDKR